MGEAQVEIAIEEAGARVRPEIYGHFAEHLGGCIYGGIWVGEGSAIANEGGIRLDTVDALRRLELPVLRWPGGCFADNYHWRDGIGPRDERPTRLNLWWAQGESNAFGTHEFVRFCRMIGTKPYICANLGSGTPEEARSWLEYCNATQDTTLTRERAANGDAGPFDVKYWGVGNENWGCGGSMTPEHYANLYRQFATYLRRCDDKIALIACGSEPGFQEWNRRFMDGLRGCESLVDAIAIHHYSGWGMPGVGYEDEEYYRLLTAVESMERHIEGAARLCRERSSEKHRVGLIVDEWGTWYREAATERGLRQDSTMADAIFAGLCFHMFHHHAADLAMTNMAQTVNVLQALVLTEGPKLCLTPTYWVYDLLKPHRDGQVVPATLRGPWLTLDDGKRLALCSASATSRGRQMALSLVNADLSGACQVAASLTGAAVEEVASARVLTSSGVRDHNTPDQPDVITPATLEVNVVDGTVRTVLPACAVAMIELVLAD